MDALPEDAPMDVVTEDGPCDMPVLTPSDPMHATRSSDKGPTIDGDLSDWDCVPRYGVDDMTGIVNGDIVGDDAAPLSYEVAVQWNASALFFAVRVTDGHVEGTTAQHPWENDSVEIYAGGDPPGNGAYTSHDHQLVVDYAGFASLDAFGQTEMLNPEGAFHYAAKMVQGGYVIEAKIDKGAFGVGSFAAGDAYPLDFSVNRSKNNQQVGSLLWVVAAVDTTVCNSCGKACACMPGAYPWQNVLTWGTLVLDP